MVNALAGLAAGANFAQGLQNTYDNSRLNMLSGRAYNAPQAERQSLLGEIASVDPRAAQAQQQQWQADEDRQTKMLVNTARYMKGALDRKDPAAVAGAWNSVRPALIRAGLATEQELSPTWDPSYEQTVHQVLAMGGGGDAGPYADLPSDIRSLKLLQESPELAALDRERRQAGGMVPKLVQTAQGYGWGTPGGEIQLAPMGGVASQAAAAPGRADMEADIGLANEMIAAGIPEAQVDAFLSQRGQRTPAPAASQGGAVAQPYQSPAEQQRLALAQASDARAQQQLGLAARAADRADRAEQRQIAANSVSGRTPNEGERNASGFYQRMVAANAEMKRLTDAGYDPTNLRDHLAVGSAVGNFLASTEGQQYNQAAMNWVRANLRKESGAAIGVDEARQEIRNYFPQPGDSPAVAQQKAKNRLVVEQAMLQAAGRAAPQQAAQDRPQSTAIPQRAIVRTGTSNGRKVIQYSDGSVEYGN